MVGVNHFLPPSSLGLASPSQPQYRVAYRIDSTLINLSIIFLTEQHDEHFLPGQQLFCLAEIRLIQARVLPEYHVACSSHRQGSFSELWSMQVEVSEQREVTKTMAIFVSLPTSFSLPNCIHLYLASFYPLSFVYFKRSRHTEDGNYPDQLCQTKCFQEDNLRQAF